jgi:hypothetical protein
MGWNGPLAVALIMAVWLLVMTCVFWGLSERALRQMRADPEAPERISRRGLRGHDRCAIDLTAREVNTPAPARAPRPGMVRRLALMGRISHPLKTQVSRPGRMLRGHVAAHSGLASSVSRRDLGSTVTLK